MKLTAADDPTTLAALGVVAFALANVSHEGLGHGLATLAVGGKAVLLTTCYFTSDGHYSKWIPAAGGLMNLAVGFGALAVLYLLVRQRSSLHYWSLRYFLILVAAFNLFFAFGYPAYSAIAQFGDWAAVISGFQPAWLWRVLLALISILGYYASMLLLVQPLAPFAGRAGVQRGGLPDRSRLQRITLIPYLAAIVAACAAGALNPGGWRRMLNSGLPAAAAAFGLTQIVHFIAAGWKERSQEAAPPIRRSWPWIAAGILVLLFFVGVLGPGIRFR